MTLKPKILYSGKDHPSLPSGYGIISRYFLPLLGDYYGRENIIIYTPVFQRDAIGSWEGMTVVSGTEWGFGENLLQEHYETYGCNLLLQLGDTWPLGILPDLALADKVLWVQWMPVDWLGMPKNIINRIKPAHKLIPFSQYGENSLRKADLPNVGKKIWLGLNTHLWRPIPRENLPGVMESLAFSNDTFNILIVAANQERKRVRLQLEAIALLRRTNPDFHPRLYLHSQINGERDLRADMDELGILDINVFPDPYLITQGGFTEEQMVSVFNCADVVLNVCMEGFGYAHIQAQACGVPVVALSEGAGPELVQFGIEVPPIGAETSPHQMTQPIPNQVAIAKALEELWRKRQQTGYPLRNQRAVDFVQENFSWDKIASQWFEVIDQCMEERERYCMSIPRPSEEVEKRASEVIELS